MGDEKVRSLLLWRTPQAYCPADASQSHFKLPYTASDGCLANEIILGTHLTVYRRLRSAGNPLFFGPIGQSYSDVVPEVSHVHLLRLLNGLLAAGCLCCGCILLLPL